MITFLKFLLFGDQHMGYDPHYVEFGVKFGLLLKNYVIT
jgi:hypothetical protein